MSEDPAMPKLSLISGGVSARRDFERLIRPHFDSLYRAAFRFTGTRHDAEDLVQDTFVRAYRHIARATELDNPRTWLLCIMRRLFIDQTRRYDSSHVSPLDDDALERMRSADPGPAEIADAETIARGIERGMRRLDREQRTLVTLHDMEGYSLAELQDITGLKIGTIKSKLHRARVKLGRVLQSDGGIGPIDFLRRVR